VIYAHRNEDVVNFGAQHLEGPIEGANLNHNRVEGGRLSERKQSKNLPQKSNLKPSCSKLHSDVANQKVKEKTKVVNTEIGGTYREKRDKTKLYSLLAQFTGMSELEFSKWLLSASPSEREKLLADYKMWTQSGKH
jgi:hypothetical protein